MPAWESAPIVSKPSWESAPLVETGDYTSGITPQTMAPAGGSDIPLSDTSAEDLEEIGMAPELGLKGSAAASFITDPEESAKALAKMYPDAEIRTDASGNRIIKFPSGEYAINKPGLSGQDVAQFATRTASYMLGPARAGVGLGTLGKIGGEAALIEGGLQTLESGLGGDFDAADVGGAAIGAIGGQVIGEKVMKPLSTKFVNSLTNRAAKKLLTENAPTIEVLKQSARNIYDQVDNAGVVVKPSVFSSAKNSIVAEMKKQGLDPELTPKASSLVKTLNREPIDKLSLSKLDTLRKKAMGVASDQNQADANLGRIAVQKIDDLLETLDEGKLIGAGVVRVDGKPVGAALKDARNLWGRARRSELIQRTIDLADTRRSGEDLGLRNEFANLHRKIVRGTEKGFSPDEVNAIKQVANGTGGIQNTAFQLGRLGIPEDQAANSLLVYLAGLSGGGAGMVVGGPTGAAAGMVTALAVPSYFRRVATRMTQNNAQLADAIVRSGADAKKLVNAYVKNVPKDKRSSAELAGLLLNSGVKSTETFKKTGNTLIDDAIWAFRAAATIEGKEQSDMLTEEGAENE